MSTSALPRALRALTLSYFAMGTSALAMIGAVDAVARGLGTGNATVAALVSVYAMVFALAAPLLQIWAARMTRRRLLLAGLALSTLGALASALAPDVASLAAARVLVALGGAAIGPVASALGAGLAPREQQGRALATVFAGMTLASVVSTPAAAWLAAQVGWREMFGLVALLNAGVAAAVWAGVPDTGAGQALALRSLADELRRASVASGVAVMLLYMAALFATFTLVVPLLQQRFALSAHTVSGALTAFGLAGIAGNTLAKRLADRVSADRLLAAAMLTLVLLFVAMSVAPAWLAVAFGLMVVWAVSNDIFMPSQQRRLAEIAPQARGLVLALNSSALYVGMSAGSMLAGVVSTHAGLAALPLVSAGLLVLALAALAFSRRAVRATALRVAAC